MAAVINDWGNPVASNVAGERDEWNSGTDAVDWGGPEDGRFDAGQDR